MQVKVCIIDTGASSAVQAEEQAVRMEQAVQQARSRQGAARAVASVPDGATSDSPCNRVC